MALGALKLYLKFHLQMIQHFMDHAHTSIIEFFGEFGIFGISLLILSLIKILFFLNYLNLINFILLIY